MFVPAELMDARNQYAIDVRNRAVLFNIAEDPSETNDIAGENPDIVKKMGDRLKGSMTTCQPHLTLSQTTMPPVTQTTAVSGVPDGAPRSMMSKSFHAKEKNKMKKEMTKM